MMECLVVPCSTRMTDTSGFIILMVGLYSFIHYLHIACRYAFGWCVYIFHVTGFVFVLFVCFCFILFCFVSWLTYDDCVSVCKQLEEVDPPKSYVRMVVTLTTRVKWIVYWKKFPHGVLFEKSVKEKVWVIILCIDLFRWYNVSTRSSCHGFMCRSMGCLLICYRRHGWNATEIMKPLMG